jgi:23S rRNA-/tRNA-specific pseudouridylate synthase
MIAQPLIYEDQYFYYVWKPAKTHTTFWVWSSRLEQLFFWKEKKSDSLKALITNQRTYFDAKNERWLCNRLDFETQGLCYFAKNHTIKQQYKHLQKKNQIIKRYIADVYGYLTVSTSLITTPLAHHPHHTDRMIRQSSDHDHKNTKRQSANTYIHQIAYNQKTLTTTLLVGIHRWVRHQIRAHCASIGNPIIWDNLYWKTLTKQRQQRHPADTILHLRSIGMSSWSFGSHWEEIVNLMKHLDDKVL